MKRIFSKTDLSQLCSQAHQFMVDSELHSEPAPIAPDVDKIARTELFLKLKEQLGELSQTNPEVDFLFPSSQ